MKRNVHNRFLKFACMAAALTTLLGACKLDSLGDPIIVPDVDREFYIDLWENLYPESRELVFQMETIQAQDCENATISYNLNRTGNTVKLSLNAISTPQDCQPGPAQIFASAPAGRLNGGLYTMKLDLKNTVFNEGQLTVTGDAYHLDMNTEHGFTIRHKSLFRIPEQTYWGYVVYETPEQETAVTDFIQDLQDISIQHDFLAGYYGHFTVESDKRVSIHTENLDGVDHQSFLFKYDGSGAAIRQ
ncbi:MAG: hypothetical protein HUU01_03690, partial [Saprospiraceae bacterium]|nr:hypothetical protein [Saprospiraceae bacterium]